RLALHPVHPPLHHGRTLAQPAHHGLLARQVVVEEVHLREPPLGEEHLPGAAHPQRVTAYLDDDMLALRGHGLKGCPIVADARELIPSRPLIATGPFGPGLSAQRVASAIARGWRAGGRAPADLCPIT